MSVWLLHTESGVYRADMNRKWLTRPNGKLRGFVQCIPLPSDSSEPFAPGETYRFEGYGEWDTVTPSCVEVVSDHDPEAPATASAARS